MRCEDLVILGSTGSVGVQTLDVARRLGRRILALSAHVNTDKMEQQIRAHHPRFAVMEDPAAAADLAVRVADTGTRILAGQEGLCAIASLPDPCLVVNAVVGMVGLMPTLAAVQAGHDVALANKETLVAGGAPVMRAAAEHHVHILPVDSEHSAIFQCLQASPVGRWAPPDPRQGQHIARLILTASGGPFFGKTPDQLRQVTLQAALQHPNWNMGAKITVDSATMMNKGLELIEARWLFDMDPERIDALVHRQSIVHSMIEFEDGSVLAQMGVPDMRLPILYALTFPDRMTMELPRLDLTQIGRLTFEQPDHEAFPCLGYCREAIRRGGLYPAAVNAANEKANELFRQGKIRFTDIADMVCAALDGRYPGEDTPEEILRVDQECRQRIACQNGF
ncbi:MAG: 1-deoxy-D-xylulose-5-phosphate reductoisomerase [Clostridia bacterium]|nr:1-deoxy-D-xylulose-5-phosphate reductoisomerase [Clostridia bacterium]